jgi:UDP-N-acetylglucosamine 4,6-dehydratase
MEQRLQDSRLKFFIGDVRDRDRLHRAMTDVDIVVHAAALKHVPVCEYDPFEAIKTNVIGSMNVIDEAIDSGVWKVICISTDKACAPVNLYGTTKKIMEHIFVQANSYSKFTRFSGVRYGNVIGSRGSVIKVFEEQRKLGRVTLTDVRMTRFWITIGRGVEFVIESLGSMQGGELFIPKIPSMCISDLAKVIAPDADVVLTGKRIGEKIHEVLITEDESVHTIEYDNHYVICPEFPFWTKDTYTGKRLPEGFTYNSNDNDLKLTPGGLKAIYDEMCKSS